MNNCDNIFFIFVAFLVFIEIYMVYQIINPKKNPWDPKTCDSCNIVTFYSKCPKCGNSTKL